VLTLWAAIVAEHLGFERGEALTLARGWGAAGTLDLEAIRRLAEAR